MTTSKSFQDFSAYAVMQRRKTIRSNFHSKDRSFSIRLLKTIFILLLLTLGNQESYCQQQVQNGITNWQTLYKTAYLQSNSESCPNLSEFKGEINSQTLNKNAIQLMHLVCDLSSYQNNSDTYESESNTNESGSVTPTLACGFYVPNRRMFNSDCTVTVNFPCFDVCEELGSTFYSESREELE